MKRLFEPKAATGRAFSVRPIRIMGYAVSVATESDPWHGPCSHYDQQRDAHPGTMGLGRRRPSGMARSSSRAVPDRNRRPRNPVPTTKGDSPLRQAFPRARLPRIPHGPVPTPGPLPNLSAHRQRFLPRNPRPPPTRVLLCAACAFLAWPTGNQGIRVSAPSVTARRCRQIGNNTSSANMWLNAVPPARVRW